MCIRDSAYSGGLDTSIIVPWLRNEYNCEVIAFCANLGQADELVGLEEKALASGASKVYVEDLRLEFLSDYVFPTMQAGAIYEREYLLGTSFAVSYTHLDVHKRQAASQDRATRRSRATPSR